MFKLVPKKTYTENVQHLRGLGAWLVHILQSLPGLGMLLPPTRATSRTQVWVFTNDLGPQAPRRVNPPPWQRGPDCCSAQSSLNTTRQWSLDYNYKGLWPPSQNCALLVKLTGCVEFRENKFGKKDRKKKKDIILIKINHPSDSILI